LADWVIPDISRTGPALQLRQPCSLSAPYEDENGARHLPITEQAAKHRRPRSAEKKDTGPRSAAAMIQTFQPTNSHTSRQMTERLGVRRGRAFDIDKVRRRSQLRRSRFRCSDHSKLNQHTPIISAGLADLDTPAHKLTWIKADAVSPDATLDFLRAHGLG
jgi:hypothetical protein